MHYYKDRERGYIELYIDWSNWGFSWKTDVQKGEYPGVKEMIHFGPVQLDFYSF